MTHIRIRPHHLLDILCDDGRGERFAPHEYGHALHLVAPRLLDDPDQTAAFVIAADDICAPCRHLRAGVCGDTMIRNGGPASKQAYNDDLDRRLWDFLGLERGSRMTVREFCAMVESRLDGIAAVCAHPGETVADRKNGLERGLAKMRLRTKPVVWTGSVPHQGGK
jgi:hypothetical protein